MIFRDANINNYPVIRYSQKDYYYQKKDKDMYRKSRPGRDGFIKYSKRGKLCVSSLDFLVDLIHLLVGELIL